MRASSVPIDFHKGLRGRYHSVLHRADGVSVRLEGGSYNRIGGDGRPGAARHRASDRRGRLRAGHAGLWGTLAAGGLVQNATFAGGRRPPHAERRARAITDRAGESLRQAEILVRAVADASLDGGTRDLPALRAPVSALGGGRCCSRLMRSNEPGMKPREAASRWDALEDGSQIRLTWPCVPSSAP